MACAIFYTHQTSGACAGVCACDRTHQMEKTEFLKSQELQTFLWLRYIDDIFFIWTYGTSKEMVNFLDLNVSLRNGAISAYLYVKPTDGHQYLHCKSSHSEQIKRSIPYSQALRLSRICSSEKDFKGHVDRMKKCFLASDYPENVVNEQINKVVFGKSQPSRKNSENGILFVVTYHSEVRNLES